MEPHSSEPQITQAVHSDVPCQFLTFRVNDEEFGVDIMCVREIKGWTETTRLPGTPPFMRGVMNLRGLIVPIFDLKSRFCQAATEATPKHVVIILNAGTRTIGLLADMVSDILTTTESDIKPAPDIDTSVDQRYVTGLISEGERMVVLLDIEKLLGKSIDDIDLSHPTPTNH